MADEAIRFRDVRLKLQDGRELLHGISLDIAAESVTALLGRSGSGKTTLLRTVNNLVIPTAGSVIVHSQDVSARPTPSPCAAASATSSRRPAFSHT